MIAITAVAVVLGLGASLGSFFGTLSYLAFLVVSCVVPTPLVICTVFARGYLRAFSIGALIPWILVFPWELHRGSLIALVLTLILSAVCGFLAAATWRWIGSDEVR
jgi:hypothetical protein